MAAQWPNGGLRLCFLGGVEVCAAIKSSNFQALSTPIANETCPPKEPKEPPKKALGENVADEARPSPMHRDGMHFFNVTAPCETYSVCYLI